MGLSRPLRIRDPERITVAKNFLPVFLLVQVSISGVLLSPPPLAAGYLDSPDLNFPGLISAGQEPPEPEKTTEDSPLLDEEELATSIAKRFSQIPDPRRISRSDLEFVFKLVDGVSSSCQEYLNRFPEGNHVPRVSVTLARVMLLNSERYVSSEDQKAQATTGEALSDIKKSELREKFLWQVDELASSVAGEENPKKLRSEASIIRAELHLRLSRPSESCEFYQNALELDPDSIDSAETSIKLVEALERANRFEEMSRVAEETLAKWPRTRFLPHLLFFIHKSYRHVGMLEEGLAFWLHWGPILEQGASGNALDVPGGDEPWLPEESVRGDFKTFADRAGFYVSFYKLALGQHGEALGGLLSYIDKLQTRRSNGETLSMTTKVYLEMQAEPMARRIDKLHGNEAPSIDGIDWIQPPKDEDLERRVELRIFCDGRRANGRQLQFFQFLGRLSRELNPEGLRVTWISHSRSQINAEREVRDIFRLTQDFGRDWAVGMEIGTIAPILDRHLVPQGGVVLFAIDSRNQIVWEMIDPMFWDEGLFRQVVTRLIAESDR